MVMMNVRSSATVLAASMVVASCAVEVSDGTEQTGTETELLTNGTRASRKDVLAIREAPRSTMSAATRT
jgi:hypothetical protein